MDHFAYRDGVLQAEGVSLQRLADEVGTPAYIYSSAAIQRAYRELSEAFQGRPVRIFYALKANANLAVIRTLADLGAGADVVSEGEIRKALAAGVSPDRIVFSGVGKQERELAFAVASGLDQINVESEGELELLDRIGRELGRRQPIVFRVNPDVLAGGHAKISTGSADNKFGVGFEEAERLYERAAAMAGVQPLGLAVHIGSQITDLMPLEVAFRRMRGLIERLRERGFAARRLDLGGGLGVAYDFSRDEGLAQPRDYAAMIGRVLGGLDVELSIEPGRLLVGNAGLLLARVLYVNHRPTRTFLVLDGAMNDLIRPALYDAYHEIWPVRTPDPEARWESYDVVGPVCESSDTFAVGRLLPPLAVGDLVALMTAGAYASVMASTYNARPLVPEILVRGDEWHIVRPRQSVQELISRDRMPAWLAEP